MDDKNFMAQALEQARKAYDSAEVPVGAIIISASGEVIAAAHNQTEKERLVTAHAEILCIELASKKLGNWRLSGCTLYSTLEPCPMCLGAMQLARIERLVWAAPDLRLGACGTFIDLTNKKHPFHTIRCEGGVLAEEASELMRSFFQQRREVQIG